MRIRAAALVLWLACAPPCALPCRGQDVTDLLIDVDQVVTDVRLADLDGNGLADLVVLTTPEDPIPEGRGLRVYLQQPGGRFSEPLLPEDLPGDVFLVDVGRFDREPGADIILLRREAIDLLQIRDGALRRVAAGFPAPLLFQAAVHRELAFLDASFDLDGDDLDDPVIPGDETFFVMLAGLGRTVPLDEPVARRIAHFENSLFAVESEAGKVRVIECPNGQPFLVLQSRGKIVGRRYDRDEGVFVRMETEGNEFGSYSQEVKVGTLEYAGTVFGDFNGNGQPDLLLSQRSGQVGILTKLQTRHTFFDMRERPEQGLIDLRPRQIIANAGISAKPTFSDLDADGREDLVLRFVEASVLAKFLEALLDRVVITCQAFLYDEDKGTFSFRPDWSREVPVPSDCFKTVGIEGLAMLDADFSGDGRPDLVIYESDRLLFYRGERSSGFFSSREVDFKSRPFFQIAGPFPGPLQVRDMDGDGRKEIVTYGDKIVRVVHVR